MAGIRGRRGVGGRGGGALRLVPAARETAVGNGGKWRPEMKMAGNDGRKRREMAGYTSAPPVESGAILCYAKLYYTILYYTLLYFTKLN